MVLPYPNKEKTFSYTDKDIPILGRFAQFILIKKTENCFFLYVVTIYVDINESHIIVIARFRGDQDIVLKMPPGRKVSDLK